MNGWKILDNILMALMWLGILWSLTVLCGPVNGAGIEMPAQFLDTHEVVTDEDCDKARAIEVLHQYGDWCGIHQGVKIASVHVHEKYAAVYVSLDGGETYCTYIVNLEHVGW